MMQVGLCKHYYLTFQPMNFEIALFVETLFTIQLNILEWNVVCQC